MSHKLALAKTINEYGDHAFLGMTDCEHLGMTYGCQPDCPVYQKGDCEIQGENKTRFKELNNE